MLADALERLPLLEQQEIGAELGLAEPCALFPDRRSQREKLLVLDTHGVSPRRQSDGALGGSGDRRSDRERGEVGHDLEERAAHERIGPVGQHDDQPDAERLRTTALFREELEGDRAEKGAVTEIDHDRARSRWSA